MKKLRDVETTRRDSYDDAMLNTVHRSSLMVPVLPDSKVSVSFLNHFLIKRKNNSVGCRITAIDLHGNRITSRLISVNEPRVYTLHLQRDFCPEAASFMVEFFSSNNLVIPFPAAMINHQGDDSFSSVHSYNRILNDVFEDDDVNAVRVMESSIDVATSNETSTFFVLASGNAPIDDDVLVRHVGRDSTCEKTIRASIPRLSHKMFVLDNLFPDWPKQLGTVLIKQPYQPQFYGRLLVGQMSKSGAFVGNHSYYDSSTAPGEYWDDSIASFRTYPIIPNIRSLIRIYPIQSRSTILFTIQFNSETGESLGSTDEFALTSPGVEFLELDISQLSARYSTGEVSSFTITGYPRDGNTPTRINHQLVFKSTGLESSINVSLLNLNVIHSDTKPRTFWGQLLNSPDYKTWLAITNDSVTDSTSNLTINVFSETGLLTTFPAKVQSRSTQIFNIADLLPAQNIGVESDFLWYEFESTNHFLTGFSVTRHKVSGHCTGEHSF